MQYTLATSFLPQCEANRGVSVRNLPLLFAFLLLGTSHAALAQGKPSNTPSIYCNTCDSEESGGSNGGEVRRTESFSPNTGSYEAVLTNDVVVTIDKATNRLYVHNAQGVHDVEITDQVLVDAGITRQQFNEMLSANSAAYQSAYDLNGDGLRNDGSNLNTCVGSGCTPWTPVTYNSGESLTFDRVQLVPQAATLFKAQPSHGMTIAASTACRDLRDYSYMGLKAAVVVGIACAATVGLGCASAVAGLAYYTYRRQQAFAACR